MKITVGGYLDHFFQQTRNHHVRLSMQADFKAQTMMTVASLVITLSARYLTEPALQWAAVAMILFCMLSVFSAILAVMPRLPRPLTRSSRSSSSPPRWSTWSRSCPSPCSPWSKRCCCRPRPRCSCPRPCRYRRCPLRTLR